MKTKFTFYCLVLIMLGITRTATAQWNNQNSGVSNELNHVHFIDGNTGWAVGRQGTIIRTTNGGSTWTQENSGTTKDLNKVFMVSSTVGYAVGDNGTVRKYNGSTWTTININYSLDMSGVYFLDANTGWISGDYGRIMYTSDGGSSWTTQMSNSTYTNYFRDIYMLSATDGWAVGTMGRVLRWNGSNWLNQSTPATADLKAVHFSSPTNGFIGGVDAAIFHFDGSNWQQHSTPLSSTSYYIEDIQAIDQNNAYAVVIPGFGGDGHILKYNGTSWSTDYVYTGMNSEFFSGIHMINANAGYVVGTDGGGMIKKKGNTSTSGIASAAESLFVIEATPNPFSDRLSLSYTLAGQGQVTAYITDITGKLIYSLTEERAAGNHLMELDGALLAPGIYFVKITTPEGTGVVRMVKQ